MSELPLELLLDEKVLDIISGKEDGKMGKKLQNLKQANKYSKLNFRGSMEEKQINPQYRFGKE